METKLINKRLLEITLSSGKVLSIWDNSAFKTNEPLTNDEVLELMKFLPKDSILHCDILTMRIKSTKKKYQVKYYYTWK